MLPIPLQPSDVTPEWLSAALRLAGFAGVAVHRVRAERMQSLTSTMHRLHVTYAQGDDSLPRSLIWKQSSVDPAVRVAYGHYRGSAYEREVRFYREVAATTRARVPHCYLAEYEVATDEHVLLLEDLGSTHHPGDPVTGVTADQAALCLRELALLHAACWGEARPADAESVASRHRYFIESLAECREFLSDAVGTSTFEALSEASDLFATWVSRMNAGARAVIHADAHPGNVLFPTGSEPSGEDRAVLVDWQGWREGPPARDVGRSLVLMLDVEERRHAQRELVADYCSVLHENGVAYDEDQAFADYRIAAANQWTWAATFARRRNAWDASTRASMPELIRRAAQAALDALADAPV